MHIVMRNTARRDVGKMGGYAPPDKDTPGYRTFCKRVSCIYIAAAITRLSVGPWNYLKGVWRPTIDHASYTQVSRSIDVIERDHWLPYRYFFFLSLSRYGQAFRYINRTFHSRCQHIGLCDFDSSIFRFSLYIYLLYIYSLYIYWQLIDNFEL